VDLAEPAAEARESTAFGRRETGALTLQFVTGLLHLAFEFSELGTRVVTSARSFDTRGSRRREPITKSHRLVAKLAATQRLKRTKPARQNIGTLNEPSHAERVR
jgi:hypothetical protein